MRLISLVLALVIIVSLLVYYKDSMFGPKTQTNETVAEQSRQIIDNARQTTDNLQKSLDTQQKRMEQIDK